MAQGEKITQKFHVQQKVNVDEINLFHSIIQWDIFHSNGWIWHWKFIYDFVFNSKIKLIFNNEPKLLMTGDIVSTHERRHEEIKCFDVEL